MNIATTDLFLLIWIILLAFDKPWAWSALIVVAVLSSASDLLLK